MTTIRRATALFTLLLVVLAVPAGASAKSRVFKGSFRAVGADGAYSNKKFGKAQLVDGRRNDKLSVHVRHLAPRTTYAYGLYRTAKGSPVCEQGASGGELVTDFTYTPKRTNKAGNFNAKSRSKTFQSHPEAFDYFVLVSTTKPDGSADQAVACAALRGKKAKKPKKQHAAKHGKSHGHAKTHTKGKAETKVRGKGQGKAKGPKG